MWSSPGTGLLESPLSLCCPRARKTSILRGWKKCYTKHDQVPHRALYEFRRHTSFQRSIIPQTTTALSFLNFLLKYCPIATGGGKKLNDGRKRKNDNIYTSYQSC